MSEVTADQAIEAEEAAGDAGSIMEQLRARHSELLGSGTKDFDIPGYQGEMVGRFNIIDLQVLGKMGAMIQKQIKDVTEQQLISMLDLIIRSCSEMFYRGADEKLVPLSKVLGVDTEVRFDSNLAEFLGHSVETAREATLAVFGGNEIMVMRFAMKLQAWMSDTTKDADRTLAGEL